ncbi:MAG: hypothetical protein EOO09_03230 [Chitinophagaceae bacterium]|nr:MAG: hypothetical protein EOO09_03230 [Chitinophagaceae bacterium]
MTPDKSGLLERISSAINQKWFPKSDNVSGEAYNEGNTPGNVELIKRNRIVNRRNSESIEKLEKRIDEMTKQYDQLFCFVNFLVDNFPELVASIVKSENQGLMAQGGIPVSLKPPCTVPEPCPTRREKDILALLVKGLCAKEIAQVLFISVTTVITHKRNLKEKYSARNTAELISKAYGSLSETE